MADVHDQPSDQPSAWHWDPGMERVRVMADQGEPLAPRTRAALRRYLYAKRAAKSAGADTRRPA